MSDKEKFEVLWHHHHRQIEENRAVYKTLDEMRAKIHEMRNRIKELENALTSRAS